MSEVRAGRVFGRRYLHVGGRTVSSYVVLLTAGCVLGTYAGAAVAAADGLDATRFVVAVAILLVPALVGSRLWFVLGHLAEHRAEPGRWWDRGGGGSALDGGLLLAALVAVPVLALLGLPYWRFWDAAVVTMMVGLVLTRVGCSMNGCCAGRPTDGPFGVRMPDLAGRWAKRYPAPLLEAAWVGLILVAVAVVEAVGPDRPRPGARVLGVVAAYAVGRIVIGTVRQRDGRAAWANTVVALLILAAVVGGLVALV